MISKAFVAAALAGAALLSNSPAAGAADQGGRSRTSQFGQNAVIDHAKWGGIQDWYSNNDRSIYLMDRAGRWYLATLGGPCPGLRFNNAIAFETDPTGNFDTFSSIRTRYASCHVDRLVRAPRPAAKGGDGKR
jgi:hypothetical protein